MPGIGPPPKPAHKRARNNKDAHEQKVLEFRKGEQPELPEEIDWHPRTRAWWEMWGNSPQAELFGDSDWSFLLDTALMHHAMWSKGQWTLAAEVRLRVAKLGATPEDRQRLRIMFADADAKDSKRKPKSEESATARETAKNRWGEIKAFPTPASSE